LTEARVLSNIEVHMANESTRKPVAPTDKVPTKEAKKDKRCAFRISRNLHWRAARLHLDTSVICRRALEVAVEQAETQRRAEIKAQRTKQARGKK
jgi:hypothetical protein